MTRRHSHDQALYRFDRTYEELKPVSMTSSSRRLISAF